MYSVFSQMAVFIVEIAIAIAEKLFLKKEEVFVPEIRLTFETPGYGWVAGAIGDMRFTEYRAKNFLFRPRMSVMFDTETVRSMKFVRELGEHERIYVSWKEAASDEFFKEVQTLFKRMKKEEVAPATKGG